MAVKKITDAGNNDGDDTSSGSALEDMRPVILPTGTIHNIHKSEVDGFNDRMQRYQDDNKFTNHSDLSDLDRLLVLEQLVLRWSNWLSTGYNYRGDRVNDKETHEQIKNLSGEVRNIKKSLTIDKESRDKQKAHDDVSAYIANLKFRAKHFGYKRNEEFAAMMEIFQELRAKVGLYERTDDRDRKEQKVNLEDIHKWLRDECFPLLDEIDRKFRNETPKGVTGIEAAAVDGGQKMWVQDQ